MRSLIRSRAPPAYDGLNSNAFDFVVNGDTATLTDGIPTAFNSNTHPGLCSPCTFSASGSPVESGTYAPLGASWARFGAGTYSASHSQLAAELGSAHLVTFEVPTNVTDIPALSTGKTGTYTVLKGYTSPTVIFETNAVQQAEVVGTLDSAFMQIVFDDGSMTASFSGSFPDGAGGGTWSLGGAAPPSPGPGHFDRTNLIHSLDLMGSIISTSITDNNFGPPNNSCSGGCMLYGHTHFALGGAGAPTAVGGTVQGNTSGISQPEATVAFGYVLEGVITP